MAGCAITTKEKKKSRATPTVGAAFLPENRVAPSTMTRYTLKRASLRRRLAIIGVALPLRKDPMVVDDDLAPMNVPDSVSNVAQSAHSSKCLG